ncbi:MAG: hypothetical protein U1E78_03780 [Gammaproteobacteria bacterium]
MSNIKRIFNMGYSAVGKGVPAQAFAKKHTWKLINADGFGSVAHIRRTSYQDLGTEGECPFNRCLTEIFPYQISKENIMVITNESIICDEKMCICGKKNWRTKYELPI